MSKQKSTTKNQKRSNNQSKQRTSIGKSNNTNPKNKAKKRMWKPYRRQGK